MSARVPVARATAPSQLPESSSFLICWWTSAYGSQGRVSRSAEAGLSSSSDRASAHGGVGLLPGVLEGGAGPAGDEGEALVGLGVEPGDPRLGGGERRGVHAVADLVDRAGDAGEPDGPEDQRHQDDRRRGGHRHVQVAPRAPGEPDQSEHQHQQAQQARQRRATGWRCRRCRTPRRRAGCWRPPGSSAGAARRCAGRRSRSSGTAHRRAVPGGCCPAPARSRSCSRGVPR